MSSSTSSTYISSLRQSAAFVAYQVPATAARAASSSMYVPAISASQSLDSTAPMYDLKPDCFSLETNGLCDVASQVSADGYIAYASSLR
jgi:hypothetical protein